MSDRSGRLLLLNVRLKQIVVYDSTEICPLLRDLEEPQFSYATQMKEVASFAIERQVGAPKSPHEAYALPFYEQLYQKPQDGYNCGIHVVHIAWRDSEFASEIDFRPSLISNLNYSNLGDTHSFIDQRGTPI
uniref:ULP_PROTEASE domain-containing protein n=1 Tax=Steinernema glaseri TaxID=37863 RepID=A0A1I7ZQI4_9BILA